MLTGRCRQHRAAMVFALALGMAACARAETNILFVVESRIPAAKAAMARALTAVPPGARLGLLLLGHRREKDCTDIELVSPIGADSAAEIGQHIQGLTVKGEAGLAQALRQAQKSLQAFRGQDNRIVMVTGGVDACQGDPCAVARETQAAALVRVDVVGFALTKEQQGRIRCVPEATGGTYHDAQDADGLTAALTAVAHAPAPPAPPAAPEADRNLLAKKAGATLVAAPSEEWQALNDGATERVYTGEGEGVWTFREGKPATFDAVECFIPGASDYNLKDFEVLVGDAGRSGTFRSVGSFTTRNLKLFPSPYQKFTFAPVTARFLKIAIKSSHGSLTSAYELRVPGTIDEKVPPAEEEPPPATVDLLAPASGGQLVLAPNTEWSALTDGKADTTYTGLGEGVWAFRDGKPARFGRFEWKIPAKSPYNVRELELAAGDESPTGAFRALGVFTTQNTRLMPDGWQAFDFPPVTARYVKLTLKSTYGNNAAGSEARLQGALEDAAPAASPTPAADARVDLLAPAAGGQLDAASSDAWSTLNDGKGEAANVGLGLGVWSFRHGKPATFDAFEMLIPAQTGYNVREFELLAGDESPTGQFRSIGTFRTTNARLLPDAYQKFRFPPVTARFFKVVIAQTYGNTAQAHAFRLRGELAPGGPAPAATPAAPRPDLLATAQLVAASSDGWATLNDGKGTSSPIGTGEGTWTFPGAATFDTFEMLIPAASGYNVKDFELFVGDDAGGPFRSLGRFQTQNLKLMPHGYQTFTFPPATGKCFKVNVIATYGNSATAFAFRLR